MILHLLFLCDELFTLYRFIWHIKNIMKAFDTSEGRDSKARRFIIDKRNLNSVM